jgi:aryl-alcohol dehydrogenase-like predicted oxidoreductase
MKKNNPWSRRDFLYKPAALLAASQLLGHSNLLLAEAATPAPAVAKKIITRTLGKTGISVPIVSMGDPGGDAPGLIRRAYEVGIRHFDTATTYQEGKSETLLGNSIKEMGVRKDVVIATKIAIYQPGKPLNSAQAAKDLRETFEVSLKRLQTDYVDILYLFHVDDEAALAMEGPLQVLADLKKQGRIRATGISMHRTEQILNAVLRLGVLDIALIPINWAMASDQGLLATINRAHQAGIGLVAMKAMAGGVSQGKQSPAFTGATRTALQKWVLRQEAFATLLSSFGAFNHIEENFSVAYDLSYTDEEKKILADKNLVAELEFCHQCGHCQATCPNGTEIPTLMRAHMYALQYYPGTGHPHEALATIPTGRGLEACSSCDTCTASCAWTVNIPRKIAQLQAWPGLAQG